jgi:Transposase DDE domain/Domain of unknown function (DUF4372)
MSKSTVFPGQPVFGQILDLIPSWMIGEIVEKRHSDHYFKKFKTSAHVLTMLYASMSGATCIRGVVLGLLGAGTRLLHLGMASYPRRSTISDANKTRDSAVFGDLYGALHKHYASVFPDSRTGDVRERLVIFDSTTISLFKEILKAAGRTPADGKRKGGIKAHVSVNSGTDIPQLVCCSASARNDGPFIKMAVLVKGDIAVFDMGYNNYAQFMKWSSDGIFFVTRQKANAVFTVQKDIPVPPLSDPRIVLDQQVSVIDKASGESFLVRRIVRSADEETQELVFWTNIYFLNADLIAQIYKRRWQIELLFKRLKHNFQLKYFLGDNVNAIEIQIWCCLITHLLYKVVLKKTKREWAFSNFCDLIRQHLFTYTDLHAFIEDPEKSLRSQVDKQAKENPRNQLKLF